MNTQTTVKASDFPHFYWTLFKSTFLISAFTVGGGYASMPLIQNCVVDTYHWLTLSEFVDIFTISQMTPGPIGINAATFAGMKIAGIPGAVTATLGFITLALWNEETLPANPANVDVIGAVMLVAALIAVHSFIKSFPLAGNF